jgi:AraC-like DNA-binding protein
MNAHGQLPASQEERSPVAKPGSTALHRLPDMAMPVSAGERLLQIKYREVASNHLTRILERLFVDLTNLHFHIAWVQALPDGRITCKFPTRCSVYCNLSGRPSLAQCRACGPRHMATAIESGQGHRFTCGLGVRNFWLPIRVCERTLGILYLQALEQLPHDLGRRRARSRARTQQGRVEPVVLSAVKFGHAVRLLRHIVRYVQSACLNDLQEADLSTANLALQALGQQQARLNAIPAHISSCSETPQTRAEIHSRPLVHLLLERLDLDYAKPITLRQFARDLGMNAAYLSTLFSHTVGIPFKCYLTELRLQKAKELLGNPVNTASQVAFRIGYSSEERFRCAFKKATGLSPRTWRKTMRVAPLN